MKISKKLKKAFLHKVLGGKFPCIGVLHQHISNKSKVTSTTGFQHRKQMLPKDLPMNGASQAMPHHRYYARIIILFC